MARPGRLRKYDPIADKISSAIRFSKISKVKSPVTKKTINITDGYARTPIFEAVIQNNPSLIKWMIKKGADINHQDRDGWTPLHFAVQEKHLDIVTLLLDSGADVNLHDVYGNGPLWRAVFDARGDYRFVEILLLAGADPKHKNKSDKSPLDFAVIIGDKILKELLEKG